MDYTVAPIFENDRFRILARPFTDPSGPTLQVRRIIGGEKVEKLKSA
jgi:hypothetical protein